MMLNKNTVWLKKLILILLVLILIIGTYFTWVNLTIEGKLRRYDHSLITEYNTDSVSFDLVMPYRTALSIVYRNPNDDKAVNSIVEKYTSLRPLDPSGWIKGSALFQRQGAMDKSLEYLKTTHKLSKRNTYYLNKVFIRYLELNELELATAAFKDLVTLNPRYFVKNFRVLSRLIKDYPALIKNSIPAYVPDSAKLSKDYYYLSAMRVALQNKNSVLAEEVWLQMPASYRYQSKVALQYLIFLNAEQNATKYVEVLGSLLNKTIAFNDIPNGDFEADADLISPCFQKGEMKGANWFVGDKGYGRGKSLQIDFDGSENLHFYHTKCIFAVKPNAHYEVSGVWSGNEISTLSGVFFEIYAQNRKGWYSKTPKLNGTWDWQKFSHTFTVPDDVELVTYRVRRSRTDALDNKISGSVYIDDISLKEITD